MVVRSSKAKRNENAATEGQLDMNVTTEDVSQEPVAEAEPSFATVSTEHVDAAEAAHKQAVAEAMAAVEQFTLTAQQEPASQQRDVVQVITPIFELTRPAVTKNSCVRALEESVGFGKSQLYLEVAVNLAVFASSSTCVEKVDNATKNVVMEIYEQAGFDVAVDGRDYKTVRRRIKTCSDLFEKLGSHAVVQAMQGLREGKAIKQLCGYLDSNYKFESINAILEYVGKPVHQSNTSEVRAARAARTAAEDTAVAVGLTSRINARKEDRQKQLAEESDGIIVFAGPLSIVVPRDVGPSEIRAMADKLNEFAARMEAEIGTPEDQRNREMHS